MLLESCPTVNDLIAAVQHFAAPAPLLLMMLGTALGIIVGAVPGLTGAMLIALTLPLTFGMNYLDAMILLVSMYIGSISGGLISATLLRMPGTPASMMTTLDGFPLAQSGQPGRALGLGITASFVGGIVSWVFLILLASPIAILSTKLGPFEFFSLVMMALVLIASVSGKSLARGIFSGLLGIMATLPGMSPATGQLRMTFGMSELNGGFKLLPVLIGLFAVSKIVDDMLETEKSRFDMSGTQRGMFMRWHDWSAQWLNLLRSSLIGTWVGILPGIGANIGSVMAYSAARGASKHPEKFGHGSEEGIIASEAANNATVGGALIPLVAMGIPGSVIDAILLGALVIHGLQPGPLLFRDNPDVVYTIFITVLLANLFMLAFMLATVGWLARLINLPKAHLIPTILVFCVVGSFALNNRWFDVWVMLGFGLIGFLMEKARIPLAPFVIGFVLAPVAEVKLCAGLMSSGGSYLPILTRPVSAIFFMAAILIAAWPVLKRVRSRGV